MYYSNEASTKREILKNLLLALRRAAEKGNVKDTIKLAKYIDKILCRQSYQGIYFVPEDKIKDTQCPPNKSETNI